MNDNKKKGSISDTSRRIFYYGGTTLRKYCKEHQYNYQRIYIKIKHMTNEEAQPIIKEFMAGNPQHKIERYSIGNMDLKSYCKKYNYVYPTVKTYIQDIMRKNPNINKDEAAKKAIEHYDNNHKDKHVWFYKGERLIDFCYRKNYNYTDFVGYVERLNPKNKNDLSDEIINQAEDKIQLKQRKNSLLKLKELEEEKEILKIANNLEIDLSAIELVKQYIHSLKYATFFVYYFGYEVDNLLTIDVNTILKYLDEKNFQDLEIVKLVGYYKSNLYDTREIIYNKFKKPLMSIVSELCKSFNINNYSEIIWN